MNVQKGLHCLTGKYTNFFPYIRRVGNCSRTNFFMIHEKSKLPAFVLPQSVSSMRIFLSSPTHGLRSYSQAIETELVSKEVPRIIEIQPVKFEDMYFDQPVAHEDLLAALGNCKTVAEQMETLASTLALSPQDVQNRVKFCKTLESLFEPFFTDFKIQIFGSTANGYGFKGCDIDMIFETVLERKTENFYLERPDVPLVSEVVSGKVSTKEISELPFKEQLLFIHNVLLEYYKESDDPSIFINAHVPLIRFYHDKYNLKCDLTFKNGVAYANTKLLYFFGKLDKRVIPLMMTLRYWAKHVELVGKGLMFNTYTMSLMLVHFLQTRNPPILPSAEFVMSLSNSFEIEDMDDKSFLNIIESIPPSQNNQTLEELLKEYFLFYMYFDFTRVICPLIASSVPRDEFLSDERDKKFKMNTICVQDPMCLSHNVADLVDYKHCKKFFQELMVTCKIFQDNDVFRPSTSSWGLMNILDKSREYSFKDVAVQKNVSLTLPLVSRTKSDQMSDHEKASDSADTLLNILHHILLFECRHLEVSQIEELLKQQDELAVRQKKYFDSTAETRLELTKIKKRMKMHKVKFDKESYEAELEGSMLEQFQTAASENELVLCVECKVSKNTWLGRDFVKLDNAVDASKSVLDRERSVSLCVAKENEKNVAEKTIRPFVFLFEAYISKTTPTPSLLVNFRALQTMSFNPILGIFLKEYMPKIIKTINDNP